MKYLVVPAIAAFLFSVGASLSAPVQASASRVETGAQLVQSCKSFLKGDANVDDVVGSASCKSYAVGLVSAVNSGREPGAPFEVHRLGPNEDETVCFEPPKLIRFDEFAQLAVDYADEHPDLLDKPALELSARALASKYPCPKE